MDDYEHDKYESLYGANEDHSITTEDFIEYMALAVMFALVLATIMAAFTPGAWPVLLVLLLADCCAAAAVVADFRLDASLTKADDDYGPL